MTSYQLTAKLIIDSPFFRQEHYADLKKIVYRLKLDSTTMEDINSKIKGQVELEAIIIFLLGYYRDVLNEIESELELKEGIATLNVPSTIDGYRTTPRQLDAMVDTDKDVNLLRRQKALATSLHKNLQNLFKILLARNNKLEQLSVNYRRELTVDSRSIGV